MNPITVRGLEIGAGRPKICTPLTGAIKSEILEEAKCVVGTPTDLVEWRVDWFSECDEPDSVADVLKELRKILPNLPILFTFRTLREGGHQGINSVDYWRLACLAADSGLVDLIDVELLSGDGVVTSVIERAHRSGVRVVVSNHDFHKTPEKAILLDRLISMQKLGADITKIAVMPHNGGDILTLLDTANEMLNEYADRPFVAISMSGSGLITRISGELFGSSLTFGTVGKASAPGQIDVHTLDQLLTTIHDNL